jgi:hypothetical protein
MKIAPYIEKLGNSQQYKDFQKKNSDAFLVAGFFVLDLETGQNLHQIDYYIPSTKKIAAFTLDKGVTLQILETLNKKTPEKLDIKTNIDLDQMYGILEDEMKNRSITDEIKKIIAVVQNIKGKKIWNINCILSGMSLLTAHVEDSSKTVLKMERKSLMDYMQRMPGQQQIKAMPTAQVQAQAPAESAEDAKEKLKKLEELEAAIEKEKENLNKAALEKEKSSSSAQQKKAKKK